MTDQTLIDAFEKMLQDHSTPQAVRDISAGGSSANLWQIIEQSGFADALVPEEKGGAGLSLADVFPLLFLCGRYALPVPYGDTIIVRAASAKAGEEAPEGPVLLTDEVPGFTPDSLKCNGAVLTAALMAGAMERVLEMTVEFAGDRNQFGRPIGKFQAVQQLLSVMAEQSYSAKMAAELGCQSTGWQADPHLAALAKSRCSEAAKVVAANAHAVHGAIGATDEYDLHLFTRRLHQWRNGFGSEGYWNKRLGEMVLASDNNRVLDDIRDRLSA